MAKEPVLTPAQWNDLLKGRIRNENSDMITLHLRRYHITPGTSADERFEILDKIDSICLTYLRSFGANWRSAPLLMPMLTLGLIAERHKKNIRKSQEKWNQLRSSFGPSSGGTGKMLINASAGLAEPSARGNYWLERADPKHRSWGHQGTDLFDSWYRSSSTKSFWDWLEETGQGNYEGVKYLDPKERWRYWVVFGNDLRLSTYNNDIKKFDRFTTRAHMTAFSGQGFAIYVCSPSGILYTGSHAVSRFHHSSFLAGKRVMGAGEWVVSNGVILLITHKTGHYRASPQNLLDVLRHLDKRTDINRTIAAVTDYARGTTTYVNARQWINARGITARCKPVTNIDVPSQAKLRARKGVDWDFNPRA